jgi:hypothetical protein
LTTLLQRKGRVLDAMASRMLSRRQELNSKDQALLNRLGAINGQLGTLYFQGQGELTFKESHVQAA